MKILRIQSVSDIITNSSSEVFICDYDAPIPHGQSYSYLITKDFLLRRNEDDAYDLWAYLKETYGIVNPLMGHYIDPDYPDRMEYIWSSDIEKWKERFGEPKTNKYYMDLLDKFVEEHKELKDLLDGEHWLVSISDHDDDYMDYNPDGIFLRGH